MLWKYLEKRGWSHNQCYLANHCLLFLLALPSLALLSDISFRGKFRYFLVVLLGFVVRAVISEFQIYLSALWNREIYYANDYRSLVVSMIRMPKFGLLLLVLEVMLEELAFRGTVFYLLSCNFKIAQVILYQAIFFALWHLLVSKPTASLNSTIGNFLGGVVYGTQLLITGNILVPILTHFLFNLILDEANEVRFRAFIVLRLDNSRAILAVDKTNNRQYIRAVDRDGSISLTPKRKEARVFPQVAARNLAVELQRRIYGTQGYKVPIRVQ